MFDPPWQTVANETAVNESPANELVPCGTGTRDHFDEPPRKGGSMPEVVLTTTHPVVQCVGLRTTFAGRFRFEGDESHGAERPAFRAVEAPWLTVIPAGLAGSFRGAGACLRRIQPCGQCAAPRKSSTG